MTHGSRFQLLTVGWSPALVEKLLDPLAAMGVGQFSHLLHPRYVQEEQPDLARRGDLYFFRDQLSRPMPETDWQLLASLERTDVPTIHNMILGDRVVRTLGCDDALSYVTFLARRLIELLGEIGPDVVIGGFDSIHASLSLAVARRLGIPWFAMHFSVIPAGLACFCDRMSPAARIQLTRSSHTDLRELAEASLEKFVSRSIQAPAYIAPPPDSLPRRIGKLPRRLSAVLRTMHNSRSRERLKFTEGSGVHSVTAALRLRYRAGRARRAIETARTLDAPPATPYVLFGLHFQPESSIDVWAPFFSNQMWVIELLSRSIPPSHKLLVKIHKSDVSNYSTAQLQRMCRFPGVELVRPFADTRSFVERAALVIAIQGTMGLEAALLGRPVIMLGESPVAAFPSASQVGEIWNLPELIRRKLTEPPPGQGAIVEAFAGYLAPFVRASHNDWTRPVDQEALHGYARLFAALKQYMAERSSAAARAVP